MIQSEQMKDLSFDNTLMQYPGMVEERDSEQGGKP